MRAGEIVQIGRPEEIVGAPADDYVSDFVQDVPKSYVLTLGWIKRPVKPEDPLDGPEMAASSTIRSAVHVAAAHRAARSGSSRRATLVGMVDRTQILSAIAGAEPDA